MIDLLRVFTCLILLFSATPALAQIAPQPDAPSAPNDMGLAPPRSTQKMEFRNFIWGVSKDDVKQYETAVLYKEEPDTLYYVYKPDYFRRAIRYDFQNDRLVGIRHSVEDFTYPNSQRIVEDSQDLQQELTKQYGEPSAQEFFWKNKQYEKFPTYWGRSLYSKDLVIQITWLLADAKIVLHTSRPGPYYNLYYTIEPLGADGSSPYAIDLNTPAAPQEKRP